MRVVFLCNLQVFDFHSRVTAYIGLSSTIEVWRPNSNLYGVGGNSKTMFDKFADFVKRKISL